MTEDQDSVEKVTREDTSRVGAAEDSKLFIFGAVAVCGSLLIGLFLLCVCCLVRRLRRSQTKVTAISLTEQKMPTIGVESIDDYVIDTERGLKKNCETDGGGSKAETEVQGMNHLMLLRETATDLGSVDLQSSPRTDGTAGQWNGIALHATMDSAGGTSGNSPQRGQVRQSSVVSNLEVASSSDRLISVRG